MYFEFPPFHCFVKSQGTKEVLWHGVLGKDGLYRFHSFNLQRLAPSQALGLVTSYSQPVSSSAFMPSLHVSVTNTIASCNKNNVHCTSDMWHNRLGHASKHVVSHVLNQCHIPFFNKMVTDVCKACCLGKAHHLPPSSSSYTFPLELVFTDLWGPAPVVSLQGY